MGKYKDIDDFINKISQIDPPDLMSLNIYKGEGKDSKIRRKNLHFYLEKMKDLNPSRLFVGEAPGRWGCFRTGIPFTDINTLAENDFFKERKSELELKDKLIFSKENREKKDTEATSRIVWKCLKQLQEKGLKLPLLWNIYPFHPSDVTDDYTLPENRSNETPKAKDRELGKEILFDLLKCFDNIKEIYPVGEQADETLRTVFSIVLKIESRIVRIPYIRHPSRSPIEFIKEFDNIYQIYPKSPDELMEFKKRS